MPSSLLDAPVGGPRHHNLGRVREPLASEQRNLGLWICECRCGAPGWRTTRLGAGDSTWLLWIPAVSACLAFDLSVGLLAPAWAHQPA